MTIPELFSFFKKPREVYVYLYLLAHADEDGMVRTPVRKIAEDMELPVMTVSDITKRLCEKYSVCTTVCTGIQKGRTLTVSDIVSYKKPVCTAVCTGEEEKQNEEKQEKEKFPSHSLYKEKEEKEEKVKEEEKEMSDMSITHEEKTSFSSSGKTTSEELMNFFNELMEGCAIPKVRCIQGTRKAMFNARIKEHGEEAVREAFTKASKSSFLNGGVNGFVANFDWIIRPNNFPKVLEGNYDDHKPQQRSLFGGDRILHDNSTDKFDKDEEWK